MNVFYWILLLLFVLVFLALFQLYTIFTSQANIVSKQTELKLGPDDRHVSVCNVIMCKTRNRINPRCDFIRNPALYKTLQGPGWCYVTKANTIQREIPQKYVCEFSMSVDVWIRADYTAGPSGDQTQSAFWVNQVTVDLKHNSALVSGRSEDEHRAKAPQNTANKSCISMQFN